MPSPTPRQYVSRCKMSGSPSSRPLCAPREEAPDSDGESVVVVHDGTRRDEGPSPRPPHRSRSPTPREGMPDGDDEATERLTDGGDGGGSPSPCSPRGSCPPTPSAASDEGGWEPAEPVSDAGSRHRSHSHSPPPPASPTAEERRLRRELMRTHRRLTRALTTQVSGTMARGQMQPPPPHLSCARIRMVAPWF